MVSLAAATALSHALTTTSSPRGSMGRIGRMGHFAKGVGMARVGPSFRVTRKGAARSLRARGLIVMAASPRSGGDGKDGEEVGAGLKAVWYGAEAVGKVVGATKEKEASASRVGAPSSAAAAAAAAGGKLEREQVLELLREDYDSNYFVSGVGELAAYVPDCEFSDPFVAFKGVSRFKENVSNLGGMMEDIDLKITQWEEKEDSLVTSWKFSCILDLPWRPKLAAAGGTTHVFDGDNRVVKHVERWDVDPKKVVQQLLLPSSKIPESRVEVFMFALSAGDALGMWLALSPPILRLTAPWVGVSLAFHVLGLSAEGTFLEGVDNLAFALLILSATGEVTRFFKGIIGS